MSSTGTAARGAGGASLTGTRVLVVDDHRTFAELLSRALDAEPDLHCVGHAHSAAEAMLAVPALDPDVVLMDISLPDGDGITTTAELTRAFPEVKVLILTGHAEPDEMSRAGDAGASGFLAKNGSFTEVLYALRCARGETPDLPAELSDGFTAFQPVRRPGDDLGLTPRELEVLALLGRGYSPHGIAKQLGVSVSTCRGHVKNILIKLDAHSQLEAVVIATRSGLIRVGD